jgi:iron complex outermembrane receptor protein
VNDDYLRQNLGGSLMKSLERLPGVSTIDIGAGQSKPVIRGLGFNRVVVVENNIKHESQQWGADHGLEIDQFAAENIEVIKGPASLRYGSDAIGGIIHIKHNEVPQQNTIQGKVDIIGKSNNDLLGTSVFLMGRKKWLYAGIRATVMSYGDYRVPTDNVVIFPSTAAYDVKLPGGRMRNTAGYEHNYHATIGFVKSNFQNRLIASYLNSKGGLFANAQGLEAVIDETTPHDESFRDIQRPYHKVSHIKISNNTRWVMDNFLVETNLGFQRNFRQEWSRYVAHDLMPPVFPEAMPFPAELEREFEKDYYSAVVKTEYKVSKKLLITSGFNTNYQKNSINGRGFIIPAFWQFNLGGYLLAKYSFSDISVFRIGGRYDFGEIQTESYFDWYAPFNQRASEKKRDFSSFSWSVGYNYTPSNWIFKLNAGKSFRMPTPQELAANGLNYHYFRYEIGDSTLLPEISWQLDAGVEFSSKRFAIGTSPFLNYFSNYIYLNPTSNIERGYQIFNYTQSRVFRYGAEVHAHYDLLKDLRLGIIGEYVYSLQLSGDKEGFTLPFSPAPSAIINLKYQKEKLGFVENIYLSVDYRLTAAQNDVVPPEEVTPAYTLINMGIGGDIKLKHQKLSVSMQVQNLFNATYLNHTSFYRLMNVPEPGRNFVLNVSIPFSGKKNHE